MGEGTISKERLLYMFSRLNDGKPLYKKELEKLFGRSPRSIQRDIDDLRSFFAEQATESGQLQEIIYDKQENAYLLQPPSRNLFTDEEIFATLKILLESRALTKAELYPIIDKLIECCLPRSEQKRLSELIGNEKLHYVELQHHDRLLQKTWALSAAVREQREVELLYQRPDSEPKERLVQPVGIMFSEFYFYLIAFMPTADNSAEERLPRVYRIDRVRDYRVTDKHFTVPYADRFEEGEFRKRIQFMFPGKLERLRFYFKGRSPEYVLDRLPTAQILRQDAKGFLIQAEVYGEGVDIWLKSQGEQIEVVSVQEIPFSMN